MVYNLRKLGVAAALLFGWVPAVHATSFYLADDAITIDNDIEAAWDDYKVVEDGENNTERTRHCWNTSLSDWDEVTSEADCSTYLYDPEGQIDIEDGWFGVNETNMILAFTTAAPMFSIKNMTSGESISMFDEELVTAGITALPEAFDHDMVFAFDTDPAVGSATSFDWYMVANIQYDLGQGVQEEDGFLQIYQDSGDTNGFQADEDIFVEDIDTANSEVADDMMTAPSATMEIRQNIEAFYTATGITSGDDVKFRLETHSVSGDTTSAVRVTFSDSEEITEDAIVVGSGASSWDGRNVDSFPRALVTAYATADQSELLQFEAYPSHVGAQVAVGDVDGDGEQEIVTLPFRSRLSPGIKAFSLSGELEAATVVPKRQGERLKRYHLAVGDVNGDGQDDVVISNANGEKLYFDVLTMEDGSFTRLAHFHRTADQPLAFGYSRGSWVEVSDLDEDGNAEIITAPERGGSRLDVFSYANGEVSFVSTTDVETDHAVHIAAMDGAVLVVEHSLEGGLEMFTWSADEEAFTSGAVDSLTADTTIGMVGDIAWFDGGTFAYSQFNRRTATYKHYDASGQTDTVAATFDVNSRGSFVDFVEVE